MDPNNNGEERERLEREAREVVERAMLEGERIRQEAEENLKKVRIEDLLMRKKKKKNLPLDFQYVIYQQI